jgi:hypothetical protein
MDELEDICNLMCKNVTKCGYILAYPSLADQSFRPRIYLRLLIVGLQTVLVP